MTERALKEIGTTEVIPTAGGSALGAFRMAIPVLKKWPNGTVVECRFLDGSPTQRKKVEAKAHDWEQYANIKFKFVTTGPEKVRISFSANSGSWSALGTDALNTTY